MGWLALAIGTLVMLFLNYFKIEMSYFFWRFARLKISALVSYN